MEEIFSKADILSVEDIEECKEAIWVNFPALNDSL
jgi:hypothetical protein